MQKLLFTLLLALTLLSCGYEDDGCGFSREIRLPAPYRLTLRGVVPPGGDDRLNQLYMLNAAFGFAYNDAGAHQTTDGGETWRPVPLPAPARLLSVVFADEDRGWLTVDQGDGSATVLRTTDGGRTFTERTYPNLPLPLTDLVRSAEGELFARIGTGGARAGIARSSDGGETFTRIYDGIAFGVGQLSIVRDTLYFSDSGRLIGLDRTGRVLRDAELPVLGTDNGLHVVSPTRLYVSDTDGLFESRDGGANWTLLYGREAVLLGGDATGDGLLLHLQAEECSHSSGAYQVGVFGLLREEVEVGPEILGQWLSDVSAGVYLGDGRWKLLYRGGEVYDVLR